MHRLIKAALVAVVAVIHTRCFSVCPKLAVDGPMAAPSSMAGTNCSKIDAHYLRTDAQCFESDASFQSVWGVRVCEMRGIGKTYLVTRHRSVGDNRFTASTATQVLAALGQGHSVRWIGCREVQSLANGQPLYLTENGFMLPVLLDSLPRKDLFHDPVLLLATGKCF